MIRFSMLALATLTLGALALSGCTVESVKSDTYESCIDNSDCGVAGDQCFTVDLGDGRRDTPGR